MRSDPAVALTLGASCCASLLVVACGGAGNGARSATPDTASQPTEPTQRAELTEPTGPTEPATYELGRYWAVGEGMEGCVPRGDVVEVTGRVEVAPFGKGSDGAILRPPEGEPWILAYNADGQAGGRFRELQGSAVRARGRECVQQGASVGGRHLYVTSIREADAPRTFTECPEDLDSLVGRRITLVGAQTRSKVPSVCGVDVDGAYELSDKTVEVTGRLERHVIEERPPSDPPIATRGPGTYYRLVDPATGDLAETRPH
ncbi:MAG: hypothetical protein ACOCUS_02370 [Polyangiales bacterium]